ncbi:DNA-binding CsgD family transcriptional regulator [Clostridiales Family XIII bacterium PM5-7]
MKNEFKDLTVEELAKGYTVDEDGFECIFCGEYFEKDLIYSSRGKSVTPERAILEHVFDTHGGSFSTLLSLDKQYNGLSDIQRTLLNCMFDEKDNKEIGNEMNISTATVRTHKFNLQKTKREARIFLALLEQIENEEKIKERKKYLKPTEEAKENDYQQLAEDFNGNTLHPFFTQCNFK